MLGYSSILDTPETRGTSTTFKLLSVILRIPLKSRFSIAVSLLPLSRSFVNNIHLHNVDIIAVDPFSLTIQPGTIIPGLSNVALEFGSAVGCAAVGSIETSVEATHGGPEEYHGRAAAFLFLLGTVSLEIISVCSLYQTKTDHLPQPKSDDPVYDNTAVQQSKEKTDEIDDVNHGAKTSNSPA
ncbi:hypothetical protein PAXINDRAFT_19397 [Paxillus involutus ATCC 200175]|uniref:Uncharacterized protein n=1 Tax=Paxillus involutus ATCC 200175 TaxID=664439 RepID=A0A0C9T8C5_PAXIN|nr:hypothetical protein PAXINDRAFT_19397 [Paxillus involutus ATCC 200175]